MTLKELKNRAIGAKAHGNGDFISKPSIAKILVLLEVIELQQKALEIYKDITDVKYVAGKAYTIDVGVAARNALNKSHSILESGLK